VNAGAVSAYDFIRAMTLGGFRLKGTMLGHALLERGDIVVFVPVAQELGDEQLAALLEGAQMPLAHFEELRGLLERESMTEHLDFRNIAEAADPFRASREPNVA
jgi:hypothetical protein